MKKLNVDDYGVSAIEMKNAKEISGGVLHFLAGFLLCAVMTEICFDRNAASDFEEGRQIARGWL
jgi:hypothetical protein